MAETGCHRGCLFVWLTDAVLIKRSPRPRPGWVGSLSVEVVRHQQYETSKYEVYRDGGEKYEWLLDVSTQTEEVR